MTDTTERAATTGRSGLATMNVVELKRLASGLGITGSTKMRKDDLVAAITARQVGSAPRSEAAAQPQSRPEAERAPEPVETPADPPKRVEQRSDSATRERTSVAPDARSVRGRVDRRRALVRHHPRHAVVRRPRPVSASSAAAEWRHDPVDDR